jgi:membrane fusion protein, multidrug efflux system
MPETSSNKRRGWIVGIVVLVIAGILIAVLSSNLVAWASNGAEQKTDDAYLRADVTPLSTKPAGLVASSSVAPPG